MPQGIERQRLAPYQIGFRHVGERRANAVKDALVANGIDPARITTISYGKERPAVAESNEAAWAQNRRGERTLLCKRRTTR